MAETLASFSPREKFDKHISKNIFAKSSSLSRICHIYEVAAVGDVFKSATFSNRRITILRILFPPLVRKRYSLRENTRRFMRRITWNRRLQSNARRCGAATPHKPILHRENLMRHHYHKIMVSRGVMMDYGKYRRDKFTRCLYTRTFTFRSLAGYLSSIGIFHRGKSSSNVSMYELTYI